LSLFTVISSFFNNPNSSVTSDFTNSKIFTLAHPPQTTHKTLSHHAYPLSCSSRDKFVVSLTEDPAVDFKSICSTPQFNVHSPYEMPGDFEDETTSKFFYGQDLDIIITPEVIQTDPDLRSFDYRRRNCYFDGERQLTMFRVYSRRNCEQECYSSYLLADISTKCIGFYQMRNDSNLVCDYKITEDLSFLYMPFALPPHLQHKQPNNLSESFLESCQCLDRCDDVKYNVEIFETRFRNETSKDSVELTFMYKYETFLPLIRHRSFTFEQFLGQAGGLLGLFAGISFLSVYIVVYIVEGIKNCDENERVGIGDF
jgi:amiloride-sensitive sodium channel